MAVEGKDGEIRRQRNRLLDAETVGIEAADTDNFIYLRKLLAVLRIAGRIKAFVFTQHADDSTQRILPFEYGQGRDKATFAEQNALDLLRHFHLAAGNVGDGHGVGRRCQQQAENKRALEQAGYGHLILLHETEFRPRPSET